MALTSDNYIYNVKTGGRIVVSGDVTVAEKIDPDAGLPTLYNDYTHGIQETHADGAPWECVMVKGTIITFEQKSDVDADQPNETVATVCDGTAAPPQGVLVQDAFRPFEKGDRAGVSFVTGGYIEIPIIDGNAGSGEFNNTDIVLGDYVKCDDSGRFVQWDPNSDDDVLRIGVVKYVEYFGETGVVPATFDYGFLQYLLLPVDEFQNALIRKAMEAQDPSPAVSADPLFGVRGNLDVANVYGAARINLFNM